MPERNIEQGANSQYFEVNHGIVNISNVDKDQIIQAISEWHTQHNSKQLYILVLCATKTEIEKIADLQSLSNLYDEKPENWQPYQANATETIADLLKVYHLATNIVIKGWFLNTFDWSDDDDKIDDLRDRWAKKMILVTDGIAILKSENTVIKEIFNSQENIGGFMLPLCEKMNENAKKYIISQVEKELKITYRRFCKNWKLPYFHIELEIPNKDLFFRRLTNLAHKMDIKSSASVPEFDKAKIEKKSLAITTND